MFLPEGRPHPGQKKGERTMADIQPYLQKIIDRLAVPGVQASLKSFTKNMLFKFTDTNEDWVIRFVEGPAATLAKETLEKPDITVITTTEILASVMDKKLNPMTAYMQRKIQAKGAMEDLMKLQKLML
jgi:putative sterol carrier protein